MKSLMLKVWWKWEDKIQYNAKVNPKKLAGKDTNKVREKKQKYPTIIEYLEHLKEK